MGLDDVVWAVAPSPQEETLTRGAPVVKLPHTPSRDLRGAWRLLGTAGSLLDDIEVDRVISTGALAAVPFMVRARLRGIPCHYFESLARVDGPSLTGRLLQWVPGVKLYTQYPAWADRRWRYAGSVLDEYRADKQPASATGIQSVVVTLGVETFGFRRLLERVVGTIPPGITVRYQTGHTDTSGLGIEGRDFVPADQLTDWMASADVVIAHSGVGSALTALSVGKCPVLVPRERAHNEHVDEHQFEIAAELEGRGLAETTTVERLGMGVLELAARKRVERVDAPVITLSE